MRWIIYIDRTEGAAGLDWARNFFGQFDTSRVSWICIDRGRFDGLRQLINHGLYGRCWYPSRAKKQPSYRISCQVPGPWPFRVKIRKPPVYKDPITGWPQPGVPMQFHGDWCQAVKNGVVREWIRVIGWTEVRDLNEAIVWIVAHEAFHFLRRTRQIPGRNTEIDADAFADQQLALFREPVAQKEETLCATS